MHTAVSEKLAFGSIVFSCFPPLYLPLQFPFFCVSLCVSLCLYSLYIMREYVHACFTLFFTFVILSFLTRQTGDSPQRRFRGEFRGGRIPEALPGERPRRHWAHTGEGKRDFPVRGQAKPGGALDLQPRHRLMGALSALADTHRGTGKKRTKNEEKKKPRGKQYLCSVSRRREAAAAKTGLNSEAESSSTRGQKRPPPSPQDHTQAPTQAPCSTRTCLGTCPLRLAGTSTG
mmetsp:Transcript_26714/g.45584  ORF Transcript_26714/g.45584 Transcript_26714/m.45584 type:complete len:231 (+) Transcript_26714:155-847(+)